MSIISKLFSENTKSNPLCFKEKTGFGAAWEQAALEDDTQMLIKRKRAKKAAQNEEEDFLAELLGGDNE